MLRTTLVLISAVQVAVSVRRVADPREKCQHGGDSTGCYIEKLEDVPTVPAGAIARVFYAEAAIELGSFNSAETNDFHTGITMVWDTGINMTFQWYALQGFGAALVPTPSSTGVKWSNEAKLVYSDNIKSTYWSKQVSLGEVSGDRWGEFRDFLHKFASKYTRYLLWRVVTPGGEVLVKEAICDTFTQSAVQQLFGGKLTSLPPIKRNYAILYALKVDKFDSSDWAEDAKMALFYASLAKAAESAGADPKAALKALVKTQTANKMMGTGPSVFIGGYTGGVYYQVYLVPPYVDNQYSYVFPAAVSAKSLS